MIGAVVALAALMAALSPGVAEESRAPGYAHPEMLVETAWLDENIIRPEILIVDLRSPALFGFGHIPGAFSLDEGRLFKKTGSYLSLLPPDEFKAVMESVGIGEGVHVVAVDDSMGRSAARLWWVLGYYGFDNVSLLNGGFERWSAEGRASTTEEAFHRTAVFTPRPRPERAASAEQVRDWKKNNPRGIVVDVRSTTTFAGTQSRGKRSGHIPGAVNLPWDALLTIHDDLSLFKPAGEILAVLKKAGITRETSVAAYCFDGKRASQLLFSMALVGISGANYVGAWPEWSSRNELPVESEAAKSKPAPPPGKQNPHKPGTTPPKP